MSSGQPEHQIKYMKPGDVAALFQVDPSTVRRWADKGKLKWTRTPGGMRRYYADDVYALLHADTASAEVETNEEEN